MTASPGRPATSGAAPRARRRTRRTLASTTPEFTLRFQLPDGSIRAVRAGAEEHILDAARRAGLDLPSACEIGWDLACACRVLDGEFDNSDARRYYREDTEAGFALICTARPRSDLVLLTHQREAMREHRLARGLPAPRGNWGERQPRARTGAASAGPAASPTPRETVPAPSEDERGVGDTAYYACSLPAFPGSLVIPKGRRGRFHLAVSRNGKLLFLSPRPLADLAGEHVVLAVRPWREHASGTVVQVRETPWAWRPVTPVEARVKTAAGSRALRVLPLSPRGFLVLEPLPFDEVVE